MKNYIIASLTCILLGCASPTSGLGGSGGETTSSSFTISLGGTGGMGGNSMGNCPDPTKSWDQSAIYYGPVKPLPAEVPGAAAEYVWGPWETDVKVVSFTLGWSSLFHPQMIRASMWVENNLVPLKDPNDSEMLSPTTDNVFSSDGFINIRITSFLDFIVPKGKYVVTAGLYDLESDSYASYSNPTCSDERTYYWRPVGCNLPDGTNPGPHHATLNNALCAKSFDANWAFSIEVVPQ